MRSFLTLASAAALLAPAERDAISASHTTNPATSQSTDKPTGQRERFLTEFAQLVEKYDLAQLFTEDDMGGRTPNAVMKLHAGYDSPNFNPATHKDAPQFISLTLMDPKPATLTFEEDEYVPLRMQLTANFFRCVPSDWEPATATVPQDEPKADRKNALTADQIRAARQNALSGESRVEAHNKR